MILSAFSEIVAGKEGHTSIMRINIHLQVATNSN